MITQIHRPLRLIMSTRSGGKDQNIQDLDRSGTKYRWSGHCVLCRRFRYTQALKHLSSDLADQDDCHWILVFPRPPWQLCVDVIIARMLIASLSAHDRDPSYGSSLKAQCAITIISGSLSWSRGSHVAYGLNLCQKWPFPYMACE